MQKMKKSRVKVYAKNCNGVGAGETETGVQSLIIIVIEIKDQKGIIALSIKTASYNMEKVLSLTNIVAHLQSGNLLL